MNRIITGLALILGFLGVSVGAYFAGRYEHLTNRSELRNPSDVPMTLHADSAVSGDNFAIATGRIDGDVDGVFTLDFLTGELQCAVLGSRTGKFNGLFKGNVVNDLGVGQNPKYLMVTGRISLPRGVAPARVADSVVYILDTSTGNFATYGLPWRPELASAGRNQGGQLVLLDVGKARNAPIRE